MNGEHEWLCCEVGPRRTICLRVGARVLSDHSWVLDVPTAVNMVECEQCGAHVGLFVTTRKAKVLQGMYSTVKGLEVRFESQL